MEILEYAVEILGALLAAVVLYLVPKVSQWIKADGSATETTVLLDLVTKFVEAAEQQLKAEDPTGEKRREYVTERLKSLGYEVTDTVIAMIEGAVWEVNVSGMPRITEDGGSGNQ